MGKITEHLIPFSKHFAQFNPRDARFIGSPIDLIVFDGLTEKKDVITIFFIEVKSGTGVLSAKQKKIKFAVDTRNVEWLVINAGEFNWEYEPEEDIKAIQNEV